MASNPLIIKILDFQKKCKRISEVLQILLEEAAIVNFSYRILGTGSCLPDLVVENQRFSEIVDTSDEWITSRTGISSRHISEGEETWTLGVKAALAAIKMADILPESLDAIIVSTTTPDYSTPNMACIVQEEIGAQNAFCFDINAACTGFIQAFDVAMHYLASPDMHRILVLSAECLSKITDFSDRRSCVIFGDGAGAVIIDKTISDEKGMYESYIRADGSGGHFITGDAFLPAKHPFLNPDMNTKERRYPNTNGIYLQMCGQEVYRFATTMMPFSVEQVTQKAGISLDEVTYIIPHQANDRILQAAAKRLKISPEKMVSHIACLGNTSSSSIPICLDIEVRSGRIKRGDILVMTGFGGGLTYGAMICKF